MQAAVQRHASGRRDDRDHHLHGEREQRDPQAARANLRESREAAAGERHRRHAEQREGDQDHGAVSGAHSEASAGIAGAVAPGCATAPVSERSACGPSRNRVAAAAPIGGAIA